MSDSDDDDVLFIMEGDVTAVPTGSSAVLSRDGSPPLEAAGSVPATFDENTYLRAFPDIAQAIRSGEWRSALHHCVEYGEREGRLRDPRYRNAIARSETSAFPTGGIDAVFVSPSGRCLVVGWIHDSGDRLDEVSVSAGGRVIATTRHIARCRREDAEAVVSPQVGKLLGFWGIADAEPTALSDGEMTVMLFVGRERRAFPATPQRTDSDRVRELALEYLATARYFSNPQVEAFIQLDAGIGASLVAINVEISRRIMGGAYVVRFGPAQASFDASIIVCLYGKSEFLFLQAAFFSGAPGWERYEFIYVSNSPELAETLVKEATIASRIYGVSITLVILPGNAGFGAANNVAVESARSHRIMIVNPDVFPRNPDWARKHGDLVRNSPADQVAMFGVPLYYDDGSLMHGGMFIDSDIGLSVRPDGIDRRSMLRVEHYGKGAPPDTAAFLASRPVPAVTGAFISADRGWFETVGGFSLEYVMGHYEDADICLKSLAKGKPVWLHNLPFWHLEGKGSNRRVVHEGGSTVNRWHFTKLWGDWVADGLLGQTPSRLPRA